MKHVFLVAICHNIESLCEGQVVATFQEKLLKKEVARLAACDLVVTISREDTAFLNTFGIKTFYYPYYPVDEIAVELMRIRQLRSHCPKRDFILLGTAYNFPTLRSMIEFVGVWKELTFSSGGDKLLVAGFGTELLREHCRGKDIEFLGTLSNEELGKRLSTVKACLCYHRSATGALTHVVEMRIAGVPVILKCDQHRQYDADSGITTFSNWDDLPALLSRPCYCKEIAIPTAPDKRELLDLINRGLCNK